MTPDRWWRIQELVEAALELRADQRPAFLSAACGDDSELRRETEAILNSSEEAGDFLEVPALARLGEVADNDTLDSDRLLPFVSGASESRIGPYRLLRGLGQGGMGTVFLAERADQELVQRVAIKISHAPGDSGLVRRFRSERQILAQLHHPYIARLLDAGRTADGRLYFVMDLIEGTPIDLHCDQNNLSIEERLVLFCKVCEAIQFAHSNRVVHRDIKPSNILVTAQGEPRLLDFGIAKLLDPTSFPLTVEQTTAEHRPMTPSYASPEQILGGPITERSDVYSLGVLLYRLLTGQTPHDLFGLSQREVERVILSQEPLRPSLRVSETRAAATDQRSGAGPAATDLRARLAGDLDDITMTALAVERERRYASAKELSDDLERHLEHQPVLARPPSLIYRYKRRLQRHRLVVAASLLVLVAVFGAYLLGIYRAAPPPASTGPGATAKARPGVAVLELDNASGDRDLDWISVALVNMLRDELRADGRVRISSPELIREMGRDVDSSAAASLDRAGLHRFRDRLETDYLLVGSYSVASREARFEIGLRDTSTGAALAAWTLSGSVETLGETARELGRRVRQVLHVQPLEADESTAALSGYPSDPEGAQLYARGLESMDRLDFVAARRALEAAVGRDPESAVAQSALATTLSELGQDRLAAEAARRAFELAGGLPREKRLVIEGQWREMTADWPGAMDLYRALWIVFPDSQEYGLRLAAVETLGGQPSRALETVAELRQRDVQGKDPRIALAEARAARARADFDRQRRAAVRAADLGRELDAEQILARALLLQAEALDCLGRYDEATATLATAREIFERTHDRRGLAEALLTRQDPGMPRPRSDLGIGYAEAVEVFHQAGDRRGEALALVKLVRNKIDSADPANTTPETLSDLENQIRQALALAREIGSHRSEAEALNVLGVYAFVVERPLAESLDWFEQALEAARQSGDRRLVAGYLLNIGNIFVGLGDLPAAVERFEASIAIAREIESRYILGMALGAMAALNLQMAKTTIAEERSREALILARDIQNQNLLDLTLGRSISVAAVRGDSGTVEVLCEELIERIRVAKRPASYWGLGCPEAWISLGQPERAEGILGELFAVSQDAPFTLARALLDQGKVEQARRLVEPLEYGVETPFPAEDNLRVEVTALVDALDGGTERARQHLEAQIARNQELGYRLLTLENQLVLGRILLLAGATEEGRNLLEEVAKTARELGCETIRRQASKLLS